MNSNQGVVFVGGVLLVRLHVVIIGHVGRVVRGDVTIVIAAGVVVVTGFHVMDRGHVAESLADGHMRH